MSQNFKAGMFLTIAFLLGSINALYGEIFYVLLCIAFLINITSDWKGFCLNFKKEWKYLLLPVAGVVYLSIHYLCSLLFADIPYKASWGMIGLLLMYFLLIPLYVVSAKNYMTPLLLRRSLFSLCWGILLFNFIKFFYITGFSLFTTPMASMEMVYFYRFGGNMELLGGFVYLEPQSIYLGISAIISYFFILRSWLSGGSKIIWWNSILIFILSLAFLSFTMTKGAIIAFLIGALFLSFVYFQKLSWWVKLGFCGGIILFLLAGYLFLQDTYKGRMEEMKNEIVGVYNGEYAGGTVASRAGIIRESFSHFDEFGLFGLGVYKKKATLEWYQKSDLITVEVTNAHNSYLEFWLIGGIPGLFFILYYFLAPLFRMIRQKKKSFLSIAILTVLFVANLTCVLIVLVDSNPFVLFMLAMAYIYQDQYFFLQDESHQLQNY